MNLVNILFAIKDSHYQLLRDNFRRDADGNRLRTDLTDEQAKKMRNALADKWKSATLGGSVYHVLSMYIPALPVKISDTEYDASQLRWVNWLDNKWPSVFIPVGAWNPDGSQYGTTIVPAKMGIDADGNLVELEPETVIGTPAYPIHPRILDIMPDDDDGSPATAPKEVSNLLGWAPRRWS